MNQVTLNPDGELRCGDRPVTGRPLRYLGHQLELADQCTLRCFFSLLVRYPILAQLNDVLQTLSDAYHQCPSTGCSWPELDRLLLVKIVEMIGYPGRPRMEIHHVLRGVRQDDTLEVGDLPLKALLDMPLALGRLKHLVFGDRMDAMEFDTTYTLFEFIDNMAWLLSFHSARSECLLRS